MNQLEVAILALGMLVGEREARKRLLMLHSCCMYSLRLSVTRCNCLQQERSDLQHEMDRLMAAQMR